jgi:hypothetical protein
LSEIVCYGLTSLGCWGIGLRVLVFALLATILGQAPVLADMHGAVQGAIIGCIITDECKSNQRRSVGSPRKRVVDTRQREQTAEIQRNLNTLGFNAGVVDGHTGRATRAAISSFQDLLGVEPTGSLTSFESRVLQRSARIAEERPELDGRSIAVTMYSSYKEYENSLAIPATQPAHPMPQFGQSSVTRTDAGPPVPSRIFSPPSENPPRGFRGYGIIAFKSVATDYDSARHSLICEAYVASFLSARSVSVPNEDQFVTVWPLKEDGFSENVNLLEDGTLACKIGLQRYDLAKSSEAIRAAREAGFDDQGIGPFLLGWLPATKFGERDALILSLDMSNVRNFEQALVLMQDWRNDIENDPSLRNGSISLEGMRRKIRRWSDQHGPGIFSIFVGG